MGRPTYWKHYIAPPKIAFPDLPAPSDVDEHSTGKASSCSAAP